MLEFYASTEGDAVLANVAGTKIGAKGRPLPGSTEIRLGGYDAATGRFVVDDHGFVRPCADDEVGMLLAKPRSDLDAASVSMRSVFAEGDTWITTDHLFRRDSDGDYWFVDNRITVIQSVRGPVFCQPICDALGGLTVIDLAGGLSRCDRNARRRGRRRDAWQRRRPHRGGPDQLRWAASPATSVPPSSTLLTASRSRPPTARCRPHCERPGCRRQEKRPGITTSLTATIDSRPARRPATPSSPGTRESE